MYCGGCGRRWEEGDRFCTHCGAPAGQGPRLRRPTERRLARPMYEKAIAGVCAGLARYFGIDPVVVRLLWLCAIIFYGTGLLAYLICWIVMPADYSRPQEAAGAMVAGGP